MDSSGNLYGTTNTGGASGAGTVYELARGSGTITELASFTGTDGAGPLAGLIMDSSGNLHGTASAGGASGAGTVFELVHGSGTITTLASFSGTDGANPYCDLLIDTSGNLYGTTYHGGDSNLGTVFEVPRRATHFTITAPNEGEVSAGKPFSISVAARDAHGNLVPGYRGTVQFTSSDPSATLPGPYKFQTANGGKQTFSITLRTSGPQTVTLQDTQHSNITSTRSFRVGGTAIATGTPSTLPRSPALALRPVPDRSSVMDRRFETAISAAHTGASAPLVTSAGSPAVLHDIWGSGLDLLFAELGNPTGAALAWPALLPALTPLLRDNLLLVDLVGLQIVIDNVSPA
jgi:uncharacterized repeat protein (TIGR03803 family)